MYIHTEILYQRTEIQIQIKLVQLLATGVNYNIVHWIECITCTHGSRSFCMEYVINKACNLKNIKDTMK